MRLKLTDEIIQSEAKIHPMGKGYQFTEDIGDYTLSIVGGAMGLYGNFKDTYEVALIDNTDGRFVTSFFGPRPYGDEVMPYANIDEINRLYDMIPRL